MQTTTNGAQRLKMVSAVALMALPACVFYFIVSTNVVSIPILDDYDIILRSLTWISQHHEISSKFFFLLTSQHNGYKLMFENAVVLSEYSLFGQVYFVPLVLLGNAFAMVIFLTVIGMTRVNCENGADKWLLLVPVAWLVFQLQYASALDFASSSLQHLAVVAFALLAIFLLDRASSWTFWAACFALVLAIASSPNGFFVGAVGFLMLAQDRRWQRIVAWLSTVAAMLLIYLYHYSAGANVAGSDGSGKRFAHVNAIYALSFLGSSAARYSSIISSVILGIVLCAVFLLAIKRRYFRKNPAIFYSMLFILINAAAVSAIRSDLGVTQSLASRYRTYSNLFLVFSYIFLIEDLLQRWQNKSIRRGVFAAAMTISVAFCCLSDLAGARFLHGKKEALTASYRSEWQGNTTTATDMNSLLAANPALLRQLDKGVYRMNVPVFREAVKSGVFNPPQNP